MRRRNFVTGIALGAAACAPETTPPAPPNTVNDVTQLNPIKVARIATPRSLEDLSALIADNAGPISIGGGRFSQGGQTACDDCLFVDMRSLNAISAIDTGTRTINVQAGVTWRQIQEAVDPSNLSPKIMQSFSNFTIGGSLSVNCHGDYVGLGPVVESVREIKLVMADGAIKTASRKQNRDLFRAAIGGYGGIGVIAEATLDLAHNERLERTAHEMHLDDYVTWRNANVRDNPDAILHHAVIYPGAYTHVSAEISARTDKQLTITERLAPLGPPSTLQRFFLNVVAFMPFGRTLRERIYDPVTNGSDVVWRNYEAARDAMSLEPASRAHSTYVLQEYFVPVARFASFVPKMGAIINEAGANVLNVAIRHTRADRETLLAWARQEVFSFVLYHEQGTTEAAKEKVGEWTRILIDAAIAEGGAYYLPYQIHATREQFLAAYPRALDYFALKRRVDPSYKFRNRLWEAYYE